MHIISKEFWLKPIRKFSTTYDLKVEAILATQIVIELKD